MCSRWLLIVGSIALAVCIYWWAEFYTAYLDAAGLRTTANDWSESMQTYGECLVWNTPTCQDATTDTRVQHLRGYRPSLLWLAVGVLIAGVIARIWETWAASARSN